MPLLASLALFHLPVQAQVHHKPGEVITVNGNRFEFGFPDSREKARHENKGSGHDGPSMVVHRVAQPIKMNGEPIYYDNDLSVKPKLAGTLIAAVIKGAEAELKKLPDGKYDIGIYNVVVDRTGKLVYYNIRPISWFGGTVTIKPGESFNTVMEQARKDEEAHPVSPELRQSISSSMEQTLNGLSLEPGKKDGQPVIAYSNTLAMSDAQIEVINVQGGKVSLVNADMREH